MENCHSYLDSFAIRTDDMVIVDNENRREPYYGEKKNRHSHWLNIYCFILYNKQISEQLATQFIHLLVIGRLSSVY